MPKFVIERAIPGAGQLDAGALREIAQHSCDILLELGPNIQWLESFVTDDKVYCIYFAQDENLITEHARRGGFPADRVSRVHQVIDPTTAEPYSPQDRPRQGTQVTPAAAHRA